MMSVKTILGLALIALGVIAFVYTTRGWELASQRAHPTSLPATLGVLALAGGIVVLLAGKKDVRLLASSR